MRIRSIATAFPEHRYEQDELIAAFREVWTETHHNADRVDQLHRAVQVGGRNLALPIDAYRHLDGFTEANAAWLEVATMLGTQAVEGALVGAGLSPEDLDTLMTVTVTGVAAPSLDARVMNRVALRPDTKRMPMFGLGCVAGAAGIARLFDYQRGWPHHNSCLLSVELCSLTLQKNDLSIANLIASGLFGDGAAAVVVGPEGDGPEVLATKSVFYRDTERVMGWDIGSDGFKVVLSAAVPRVVREHIAGDVDAFLDEQGLARADIGSWVCHPGGPKVLEALEESLGLPDDALDITRQMLADYGNLSSTSVLVVLDRTWKQRRPPAGSFGLLLALGPGFCSELVLLRW